MIGETISQYRIGAKLGEGGMGVVYKAEDTKLGRTVALKFLPRHEEENRERFLREAQAAASLNHPNLCTVFEIDDEHHFIAMEFVEGPSVKDKIGARPLPLGEALDIAIQACAGLRAAHEKGIVHRDIKPANLMLTAQGQVKIMDFGLAQIADRTRITKSGGSVGTPAYMSPEQAQGQSTDRRSDIWSLGVMLYEMIAGRVPFPGKSEAACTYSIVHTEPEPVTALRSGLPPGIDRILAKALRKDPRDRYQNVEDLMVDLRQLSGEPMAAVRRRPPWKVIVTACAAGLALLGAGYYYFDRTPKLTDKDTIVLADFTNSTGDPVFDGALRRGLSVELQQSPFFTVISDEEVQRTLGLMEKKKDARLTGEIAREICVRTGSAAFLEGSIESLGSKYVLGLRATSCGTGKILDQQQGQAARREDVLDSLSQIAQKFRIRVGESLATVEKHSTPLAKLTTGSLEALTAYSTGLEVEMRSAHAAAIPFFRRAVEIDPNFAIAHAQLGFCYSNIGESVLSVESSTRAWQLRDRASDRERFFIDYIYDRQVTGNLEKAFQTLESWVRTYPVESSPSPSGLMGGLVSQGTGRLEKIVEQGKKSIATRPDSFPGYSGVVIGNFLLGRFEQAEEGLRLASARNLQSPLNLVYGYHIAYINGDQAQMDRAVSMAKDKRGTEHLLTHAQALVMARAGRLQAARVLSRQGTSLAKQEKALEAAGMMQAAAGVWEGFYGNAAEGKKNALSALAFSNGRDVSYGASLALALSGELSQSQALAADLEKRFPEDTFVQFTYLPVLRGLFALLRGRPADSIEQLQGAVRYEFSANGLSRNLYLGGLHSAYVRGQALAALRRYEEAAVEFQKIRDHRGIAGADPIGALAHLQVGRVYALLGDKAKAVTAYQEFLALWQKADPDIPILKQATAEYAKLR